MGLTSSSYRPSAYLMAQENNYVYMMYPSYSNRLHIVNLDDNTKTEIILSDSYYNLMVNKSQKYLQIGTVVLIPICKMA